MQQVWTQCMEYFSHHHHGGDIWTSNNNGAVGWRNETKWVEVNGKLAGYETKKCIKKISTVSVIRLVLSVFLCTFSFFKMHTASFTAVDWLNIQENTHLFVVVMWRRERGQWLKTSSLLYHYCYVLSLHKTKKLANG